MLCGQRAVGNLAVMSCKWQKMIIATTITIIVRMVAETLVVIVINEEE